MKWGGRVGGGMGWWGAGWVSNICIRGHHVGDNGSATNDGGDDYKPDIKSRLQNGGFPIAAPLDNKRPPRTAAAFCAH